MESNISVSVGEIFEKRYIRKEIYIIFRISLYSKAEAQVLHTDLPLLPFNFRLRLRNFETCSTRSVRKAVMPQQRVLVRNVILGLGLSYGKGSGLSVAKP